MPSAVHVFTLPLSSSSFFYMFYIFFLLNHPVISVFTSIPLSKAVVNESGNGIKKPSVYTGLGA
jgi:hypothetical protein